MELPRLKTEPGLKTIVADAKTSEYYINPDKAIYKWDLMKTQLSRCTCTLYKADRVALFVNLLSKDTEMANLFAFGVEGTDYTLDNGKISKINTDELFYEWMIYNVKISTPTTAYTDEFMDIYRNWDNESIPKLYIWFLH